MSAFEAIEGCLHRARLARRQGLGSSVLESLADAADQVAGLDADHPLRARVSWKRAKAVSDFSEEPPIDALASALEAGSDLFSAYPPGRRAAQQVARHHQDHWGYASPLLEKLWTALLTASQTHHDDLGAAAARLDRAWVRLCTDDAPGMHADLRILNVHDDPSIQLGAAYTALCYANWSLDSDEAARAQPALMAQLDDISPPLHVEIALYEAHQRFQLEAPSFGHEDPYLQALARGSGFPAPEDRRNQGPEHQLAAEQSAHLGGEHPAPTAQWGCAIFSAAKGGSIRVG